MKTSIPTRDRSLIGAWIALDDATIENGCLRSLVNHYMFPTIGSDALPLQFFYPPCICLPDSPLPFAFASPCANLEGILDQPGPKEVFS